jgi:hypothetical protein
MKKRYQLCIYVLITLIFIFGMTYAYAQVSTHSSEEKEGEDALIVKLPYFTLKLYKYWPGESTPPEGYEGMVTDRSFMSEEFDDFTLHYEIWDYLGMYGDPFNTEIHVIPGEEEFTIDRIDQQYSTTLFVNPEGMGATWPMDIEITTSEWMEIEQIDEYRYKTLPEKVMATTKPDISEETFRIAEEKIKGAQPPLSYSEMVLNAKIRFTWTADSTTFVTILDFDFTYGD